VEKGWKEKKKKRGKAKGGKPQKRDAPIGKSDRKSKRCKVTGEPIAYAFQALTKRATLSKGRRTDIH